MQTAEYLTGSAFFLGTVGAVSVGTLIVVSKRLSHLDGPARWLAAAIIGSAGIIAAHLIPGIVGQLSRVSVLACALVLLAVAAMVPSASTTVREGDDDGEAPTSSPFSWVVASIAVAVVGVAVLAVTWRNVAVPTRDIDSMDFHLPLIASWIRSRSMWTVTHFLPAHQSAYYPANGDVVFLAAVLPWRSDAFVRLVNLPFLGVAGLSAYALSARLRVPTALRWLSAALFVSLPVALFSTVAGALTDVICIAMFGAGFFFLVRHHATRRTSDLVVAGIGLGIAFGTKWYGASSVGLVLIAWFFVELWTHRSSLPVIRRSLVLGGVVLLAGAFWLVRNTVESGNPVTPQEVSLFGRTLFAAARDYGRECSGFTIAHYLGSPDILRRYIVPGFVRSFSAPGALLGLGVSVAALISVLRLTRRRDGASAGTVLAISIGSLILGLAYLVTPYSAFGLEDQPTFLTANTRYLLPSLVLAAPVGVWALWNVRRMRPAFELLSLVAVLYGTLKGLDIDSTTTAKVAVGIAVLASCVIGAVRIVRTVPALRFALVGGGLIVFLIGMAIAGDRLQSRFYEGRYEGRDEAIDEILQDAPEGVRIGLAGHWAPGSSPVLPSFGPRFRNDVAYAGTVIEGQMRPERTAEDFRNAVVRGGYDLVVIGKETIPAVCGFPGLRGEEPVWAKGAGWERVSESRDLVLFRVPPKAAR